MSFEPWTEDSVLIRFEHILEKGEDSELSKPVTFNLTQIFPGDFVFSEVTLGGNQWIGDKSRLHFKQEGSELPEDTKTTEGRKYLQNLEITMAPMEIRTFIMSPPNEGSFGIRSQVISKVLLVFTITLVIKNIFI